MTDMPDNPDHDFKMPDHDFSAEERRAGDSGGANGSAMPTEDRPLFCIRRLDVNEFYVVLCFACFDAFLHSMFPCRAFLCHPKSAGDGPDFYFYVMHVLF